MVSDAAWAKVAPVRPGRRTDRGVTAKDDPLSLEAVPWRVRTGSPWHGLLSEPGRWNPALRRFRRRVRAGVFGRVLECLSDDADFDAALIDGAIVAVHRKTNGWSGSRSDGPI